MRFGHAFAVFAFVIALAPVAHADGEREQSRAAFRKGVTAAKENDFVAARDAFIEAYRLFPHPSILLNLGIAHAKTGELVDAEQELVKFLADDGGATPEEVKSAQRTLTDVRDKLGTLALEVKPGDAKATLDGKPIVLVSGQPTPVRATAGRHALKVEAAGHAPYDQNVEVLSKIETPLKVELTSNTVGTTPQTPDAPSKPGGSRSLVGWSLIGVGALAAGAGSYFGVRALQLDQEWHTTKYIPDPSVQERGIQYTWLSTGLIAGGVVAAGIGTVLLLTKPKASSTAAKTELVVSPSWAGVRGAF